MINLTENLFIGKGLYQGTYHHPEDNKLCVKINLNPHSKASKKQVRRELKIYKKLKKRPPSMHIPKFYGTANTTLGTGYLYEKITDFDGSISLDLNSTLKQTSKQDQAIIEAIKTLGLHLLKEKLLFHDYLLTGNILCKKIDPWTYRLVIIDGLGDTVFIPILNYIPSHIHARIKKKWKRYLVDQITKSFDWVDPKEIEI